jgi:DNA-directed RNA polymerase subunit RPC12/RpoP
MSDDDERQTIRCDNCGYVGPRSSEADDGEKGIVWHEDAWTCEECRYKMRQNQRSSRSPRRGGMGSGSLGRRER